MSKPRIVFPRKKIIEFCLCRKVIEFSLVGSLLRDDFQPELAEMMVLFQV
jgi:hypothetical protein